MQGINSDGTTQRWPFTKARLAQPTALELRARAEALHADNLLAYAARFGGMQEKSRWAMGDGRWAADGLTLARQTLAQTPRLGASAPDPATNADLSVMAENHQVLRDPTQQPPRRHSALCLPRAAKQKSCRLP